MIVFECGLPSQKFGYHVGKVGNGKGIRVWGLWFAVAWYPISFHDYTKGCLDGEFIWED